MTPMGSPCEHDELRARRNLGRRGADERAEIMTIGAVIKERELSLLMDARRTKSDSTPDAAGTEIAAWTPSSCPF